MEELDLKELFNIFWNKKLQIIVIVIVFMVIGAVYITWFVTPEFSSSTTLLLATLDKNEQSSTNDNPITPTDMTLNSKLVSTYSELVKSKNVLRQVLSNLDIDLDEKVLRSNIKVSSVKDTELIEITVANEKSYYSAIIANEIARVFTEKVSEIYNINNVHVVDEAEISENASNVNLKKDVIIFGGMGFVIAVLYILIANMLDTTVKSAEDIEKYFKVPVLASIPIYDVENEKLKNRRGGKKR